MEALTISCNSLSLKNWAIQDLITSGLTTSEQLLVTCSVTVAWAVVRRMLRGKQQPLPSRAWVTKSPLVRIALLN